MALKGPGSSLLQQVRKPRLTALSGCRIMAAGQNGYTAQRLDPNDPVTMHLLMETALGDSQQYSVLSLEEAEDLKKELPRIQTRLEATKRQLAIETKVRDAAGTLTKIDKASKRGAGGRDLERSEEERAAAHQKCEELTQELGNLERSQQVVQRQLLEHTAGILTRTHKGYLQDEPLPQVNGVENRVNDYGLDLFGAGDFDDDSFYQTLESALEVGASGNKASSFKKQTDAIQETEQKLWDFNHQLRNAIAQATSGRMNVPAPPNPSAGQVDPDSALQEQVSYLEHGFHQMQRSQVESLQSYKSESQQLEAKLEDLNAQLRSIVVSSNFDQSSQFPLPPETSGRGTADQVAFTERSLEALEQSVFRLKEGHRDLSTRSGGNEQKVQRYENLMQNLWPSLSGDEKFSEDAFSSKVSSLSTRVGDLSNQKEILKRQIEQQREINSKADNEKDDKFNSMTAELEQAKAGADQAKAETQKVRQEMEDVEGELVRLQTELTVARAELDGAYGTRAQRAAEVAQHPALQQEIAGLKQEMENLQVKASETDQYQQQAHTLKKELSETITEFEAMTKQSIEFERERETLENSVDGLRDRCEALETQLNEEKLARIGLKSPGTPGDRGSNEKGATSTSVLKSEFKKMMRETRQENMKALRHEQDERRRLEAQLRELKKGQTPAKSSLSQSMSAS